MKIITKITPISRYKLPIRTSINGKTIEYQAWPLYHGQGGSELNLKIKPSKAV